MSKICDTRYNGIQTRLHPQFAMECRALIVLMIDKTGRKINPGTIIPNNRVPVTGAYMVNVTVIGLNA